MRNLFRPPVPRPKHYKSYHVHGTRVPLWLICLMYLAYLQTVLSQRQPETATLQMLIIVVGLVLVVTALVAVGAPELVPTVISNWPFKG
jgi:hypothetical protein